jgi:hypothetical protein
MSTCEMHIGQTPAAPGPSGPGRSLSGLFSDSTGLGEKFAGDYRYDGPHRDCQCHSGCVLRLAP